MSPACPRLYRVAPVVARRLFPGSQPGTAGRLAVACRLQPGPAGRLTVAFRPRPDSRFALPRPAGQ
eukprot:5381876-Heterocapsa_arctica.AAC.1